MEVQATEIRELIERLGGHPAAACGLALDERESGGAWLLLACLLGGRAPEASARAAWRALAAAGLSDPRALVAAAPERAEAALASARLPRPEVAARRLWRVSRALVERAGGEPAALAAGADDWMDLAGRFARLAPGVGPATVLRFLRPLREVWPEAREVPLAPAARAAALHLGWLRGGEDEEGEPGALRALLAREADPPALADVEAALERLGRRACLRERRDRCPLGDACPASPESPGSESEPESGAAPL